MFIELIDETEVVKEEYQKLVEDVVSFASDYLHYPENRECCISFVSSERIREINRDFRNIDKVTDVISFALDDEDEDMDPIKNFMASDENFVTSIGDIIISVDRAKEQAEEYGHSLERELGFLALHGFLHLNGYDHQTEEEEKEMTGLQKEILTAYGLTRNA
ncbi:rRNA maturation RNase YbeY [uncultured Granulicatella sp.]|uniref:rRNA maturation RNase YbeY n=1 Tax=uncultured Granulicatella sp. TaxID=316089 RepID=UPI0028D75D89|nr:rRNA maturation RNase YbeY [uncultured Granulicatella sp.]